MARVIPQAVDATDLPLRTLLTAIDGLFPVGTPIASEAFLSTATRLLRADQSALVVLKAEPQHRALRTVDSIYQNAPRDLEARFAAEVRNHRGWSNDSIANRLHRRCLRRPGLHFTFSTYGWGRQIGVDENSSLSIRFLRLLGVRQEMCSMRNIDDGHYSLISFYRIDEGSAPFNRAERRFMHALHEVFCPRLIDLRARTLRQDLPQALQGTFSLILAGKSEKEIARQTHRSPNTVHDHVKRIYAHFGVSSRGQLLSRFVSSEKLRAHSGNGRA
jgi:hypothetical protein